MHKSPPPRGREQREVSIPKQRLDSAPAGGSQVMPRQRPGDTGTMTRTGHGHRGTPSRSSRRSAPTSVSAPALSTFDVVLFVCRNLASLLFLERLELPARVLWGAGLATLLAFYALVRVLSTVSSHRSRTPRRMIVDQSLQTHNALLRLRLLLHVCTYCDGIHSRPTPLERSCAATLRRLERRLTFGRPCAETFSPPLLFGTDAARMQTPSARLSSKASGLPPLRQTRAQVPSRVILSITSADPETSETTERAPTDPKDPRGGVPTSPRAWVPRRRLPVI